MINVETGEYLLHYKPASKKDSWTHHPEIWERTYGLTKESSTHVYFRCGDGSIVRYYEHDTGDIHYGSQQAYETVHPGDHDRLSGNEIWGIPEEVRMHLLLGA